MAELKYRAEKDLYDVRGHICFTKDKVYTDLSKGKIKGAAAFRDDTDTLHGIADVEHEDGTLWWFTFFTLIEDSSSLKHSESS